MDPSITFVCREAVKLLVEKVAGAKNENLTARYRMKLGQFLTIFQIEEPLPTA